MEAAEGFQIDAEANDKLHLDHHFQQPRPAGHPGYASHKDTQ
jgi:hypothetical protein